MSHFLHAQELKAAVKSYSKGELEPLRHKFQVVRGTRQELLVKLAEYPVTVAMGFIIHIKCSQAGTLQQGKYSSGQQQQQVPGDRSAVSAVKAESKLVDAQTDMAQEERQQPPPQ